MTAQPSKLQLSVLGLGLLGPGLDSWAAGSALLQQPQNWHPTPTVVPPPTRLAPTERRRAGHIVRASLVVAEEALQHSGLQATQLATVFTSSSSDTQNCHLLCEALAAPARLVSPTRFTNSVHNAAAGYWHIATQSLKPSTSLAAFDASFAAGLLEAAVQCLSLQETVLLVACDVPYPEPLHTLRNLPDCFAVALVLAPPRTPSALRLALRFDSQQSAHVCEHAGLEALRRAIPAAQSLPLLQALGAPAQTTQNVVLDGLPGQKLALQVLPAYADSNMLGTN